MSLFFHHVFFMRWGGRIAWPRSGEAYEKNGFRAEEAQLIREFDGSVVTENIANCYKRNYWFSVKPWPIFFRFHFLLLFFFFLIVISSGWEGWYPKKIDFDGDFDGTCVQFTTLNGNHNTKNRCWPALGRLCHKLKSWQRILTKMENRKVFSIRK